MTLWLRLQIFLGFRSACCHAPITYNAEWDRSYCSGCNVRV